jgi:hypothetical protein
MDVLAQYALPLSVGLFGWLLVVSSIGLKAKRYGINENVRLLASTLIVGVGLFFATAYLFRFRFWGRHLAQFLPIFLLVIVGLADGDQTAGSRHGKPRWPSAAVLVILAMWLFSSWRLIFLHQYKKDDYRNAVTVAKKAAGTGGTIIWSADRITANYYGLRFAQERDLFPSARCAVLAISWETDRANTIATSPAPVVVVMSKPATFDVKGALAEVVENSGAELIGTPNAFKIYLLR